MTTEEERAAKIDLLARVAWNAYKRKVGGVTFSGTPMPEWDAMSADPNPKIAKIVAGWRDAALGVVVVHDMERVDAFTKAGFAGCNPDGGLVDRRIFRDAIPVPKNTLLGIPEPQPLP